MTADTTIDGTLTGTPNAPEVRIRRTFDAPVEDVWAAWTQRERMARWLGVLTDELAVGRTVMVDLGAGGEAAPDQKPVGWEVLRLDAPSLLQVRWHEGNYDAGGILTISLQPDPADPARTELTLVHALAPAAVAREHAPGFGAGWEGFLAGLAALLAGGDLAAVKAADAATWELRLPHYERAMAGLAAGAGQGNAGDRLLDGPIETPRRVRTLDR